MKNLIKRLNFIRSLGLIVLAVLLASGIVYALNFSYYQIPGGGGSKAISEHNICKIVQNNNPNAIFVPTNTSAEWSSFLSNPPASINITNCDHAEPLWSINSTLTAIRDIAVDSSGVYVAGKYVNRWLVERRSLADGSKIWDTMSLPAEAGAMANRIAVDSSGIYVGGSNVDGTGFVLKLPRTDSPVGPQPVDWRNNIQYSSGIDALAIDNGYVYVGWSEIDADGSYEWAIRKLSKNDGYLYWNNFDINPTNRNDYLRDIVATGGYIPAQYGIVVVGNSNTTSYSQGNPYNDPQWRIQKLLTNTNPDEPWHDPVSAWPAATEINPSYGTDSAWAVTLDNSGNIYVVGNESSVRLRTYKLAPGGGILWGTVLASASDISNYDYFRDIAVDSTGVYIARDAAAEESVGHPYSIITKRNLDGTYIPIWEKDLSPYTTTHSRIAAFGDGIYISNGSSMLEKRWPQ